MYYILIYSYMESKFSLGFSIFDKLNLNLHVLHAQKHILITGLDLCLWYLSSGRSGATEDSLQVQWVRGIRWVFVGAVCGTSVFIGHGCRCLDVPLFERGYGKESLFFALHHLHVLPTVDAFTLTWGSSWHCEECNCSREIQRLRP